MARCAHLPLSGFAGLPPQAGADYSTAKQLSHKQLYSKVEENDGEFHWYVYPRTPFCHYVAFPLKGKREIQRRFPFAAPPNCGGWQGNWIHREAPGPTNPVTCFPPGKVVAPATKGGLSLARQGGCKDFIIRGRLLSIKRRPLPPFEPSEPFEPERRRRLNP